MAWTENDLLRMMQTNHKIFGKEILQIKDASDEWLIKYFKSALLGLLDYRAKANCKLFNVEASQFGGIESITPKRIGLTKEQCAEIGNYLLTDIVMRDMYSGQPTINKWDSEIILNYIENGYSFMSSYKLVKSQLWCNYGTPMAETNFEKLKNVPVDEFALWLTKLLQEAQKQAYEAVDKKLEDHVITPDESQFKEWEETTFSFYKNWLESEAE